MKKWLAVLIDVAVGKPEASTVRDSDWIALATMQLSATLQGLDQLRVLTVGMVALEVAVGAFAASQGGNLPGGYLLQEFEVSPDVKLSFTGGFVGSPLGVGLVVSFLYNVTGLSGWRHIDHGPSWKPNLPAHTLLGLVETATLRNRALLDWGWKGLRASLVVLIVSIIGSGSCLLLLVLLAHLPGPDYFTGVVPPAAVLLAIVLAIGGLIRLARHVQGFEVEKRQ